MNTQKKPSHTIAEKTQNIESHENFAHNLSAVCVIFFSVLVKNLRRNACVLGQQAQTHVDKIVQNIVAMK